MMDQKIKYYFYQINKILSQPHGKKKKNEIVLSIGRNIFWLDDISQFNIKVNDKILKPKISSDEDINTQNYGIILADKIKEFMANLKILKILENDKAQEEIEKMV